MALINKINAKVVAHLMAVVSISLKKHKHQAYLFIVLISLESAGIG